MRDEPVGDEQAHDEGMSRNYKEEEEEEGVRKKGGEGEVGSQEGREGGE